MKLRHAKIPIRGWYDFEVCGCINIANQCKIPFNSSHPGKNGRCVTDDIFRCIFINEKFTCLIRMHTIISICGSNRLGTEQATNHYLKQSWPISLKHIRSTMVRWVQPYFLLPIAISQGTTVMFWGCQILKLFVDKCGYHGERDLKRLEVKRKD